MENNNITILDLLNECYLDYEDLQIAIEQLNEGHKEAGPMKRASLHKVMSSLEKISHLAMLNDERKKREKHEKLENLNLHITYCGDYNIKYNPNKDYDY